MDVDPSSISKRVKVDTPIVGDVKEVLTEMLIHLKEALGAGQKPAEKPLAAWWAQIEQWRALNCLAYKTSPEVIKPQAVVETVWRLTQGVRRRSASDVGRTVLPL